VSGEIETREWVRQRTREREREKRKTQRVGEWTTSKINKLHQIDKANKYRE